jgi:hypothetical protein
MSILNPTDWAKAAKDQLLTPLLAAAPGELEQVLDAELPKLFAQIQPFNPETHAAQVRFVAGGVDVQWVPKL